ncbi:hypothetical protein DR088_03550, partial [Mycoplasma hyopneumoniae]|nr:hypothetical protein [Mesomycoplasma hyopneumoniae]MXR64234.1 hypothetical protein [Mesomycoplasma hyopneumoniae]
KHRFTGISAYSYSLKSEFLPSNWETQDITKTKKIFKNSNIFLILFCIIKQKFIIYKNYFVKKKKNQIKFKIYLVFTKIQIFLKLFLIFFRKLFHH